MNEISTSMLIRNLLLNDYLKKRQIFFMVILESISKAYYKAREEKRTGEMNALSALLIKEIKENPRAALVCHDAFFVGIALFYTCHHSIERDGSCSTGYIVRLMSSFWCLYKASKIDPNNREISGNLNLLILTHPATISSIYKHGVFTKYSITDNITPDSKYYFLHEKFLALNKEILLGTIAIHQDFDEYCKMILLGCEVALYEQVEDSR